MIEMQMMEAYNQSGPTNDSQGQLGTVSRTVSRTAKDSQGQFQGQFPGPLSFFVCSLLHDRVAVALVA